MYVLHNSGRVRKEIKAERSEPFSGGLAQSYGAHTDSIIKER